MTACYSTPTDDSYGSRKLAHYNAWLLNPKRDLDAGPYKGFPEDLKLEKARKALKAEYAVKAEAKEKVAAAKPAKAKRAKKVAGGPSKLERALEIYKANLGMAKVNLIDKIKETLDMSPAGATTYYYNAKKLAGH